MTRYEDEDFLFDSQGLDLGVYSVDDLMADRHGQLVYNEGREESQVHLTKVFLALLQEHRELDCPSDPITLLNYLSSESVANKEPLCTRGLPLYLEYRKGELFNKQVSFTQHDNSPLIQFGLESTFKADFNTHEPKKPPRYFTIEADLRVIELILNVRLVLWSSMDLTESEISRGNRDPERRHWFKLRDERSRDVFMDKTFLSEHEKDYNQPVVYHILLSVLKQNGDSDLSLRVHLLVGDVKYDVLSHERRLMLLTSTNDQLASTATTNQKEVQSHWKSLRHRQEKLSKDRAMKAYTFVVDIKEKSQCLVLSFRDKFLLPLLLKRQSLVWNDAIKLEAIEKKILAFQEASDNIRKMHSCTDHFYLCHALSGLEEIEHVFFEAFPFSISFSVLLGEQWMFCPKELSHTQILRNRRLQNRRRLGKATALKFEQVFRVNGYPSHDAVDDEATLGEEAEMTACTKADFVVIATFMTESVTLLYALHDKYIEEVRKNVAPPRMVITNEEQQSERVKLKEIKSFLQKLQENMEEEKSLLCGQTGFSSKAEKLRYMQRLGKTRIAYGFDFEKHCGICASMPEFLPQMTVGETQKLYDSALTVSDYFKIFTNWTGETESFLSFIASISLGSIDVETVNSNIQDCIRMSRNGVTKRKRSYREQKLSAALPELDDEKAWTATRPDREALAEGFDDEIRQAMLDEQSTIGGDEDVKNVYNDQLCTDRMREISVNSAVQIGFTDGLALHNNEDVIICERPEELGEYPEAAILALVQDFLWNLLRRQMVLFHDKFNRLRPIFEMLSRYQEAVWNFYIKENCLDESDLTLPAELDSDQQVSLLNLKEEVFYTLDHSLTSLSKRLRARVKEKFPTARPCSGNKANVKLRKASSTVRTSGSSSSKSRRIRQTFTRIKRNPFILDECDVSSDEEPDSEEEAEKSVDNGVNDFNDFINDSSDASDDVPDLSFYHRMTQALDSDSEVYESKSSGQRSGSTFFDHKKNGYNSKGQSIKSTATAGDSRPQTQTNSNMTTLKNQMLKKVDKLLDRLREVKKLWQSSVLGEFQQKLIKLCCTLVVLCYNLQSFDGVVLMPYLISSFRSGFLFRPAPNSKGSLHYWNAQDFSREVHAVFGGPLPEGRPDLSIRLAFYMTGQLTVDSRVQINGLKVKRIQVNHHATITEACSFVSPGHSLDSLCRSVGLETEKQSFPFKCLSDPSFLKRTKLPQKLCYWNSDLGHLAQTLSRRRHLRMRKGSRLRVKAIKAEKKRWQEIRKKRDAAIKAFDTIGCQSVGDFLKYYLAIDTKILLQAMIALKDIYAEILDCDWLICGKYTISSYTSYALESHLKGDKRAGFMAISDALHYSISRGSYLGGVALTNRSVAGRDAPKEAYIRLQEALRHFAKKNGLDMPNTKKRRMKRLRQRWTRESEVQDNSTSSSLKSQDRRGIKNIFKSFYTDSLISQETSTSNSDGGSTTTSLSSEDESGDGKVEHENSNKPSAQDEGEVEDIEMTTTSRKLLLHDERNDATYWKDFLSGDVQMTAENDEMSEVDQPIKSDIISPNSLKRQRRVSTSSYEVLSGTSTSDRRWSVEPTRKKRKVKRVGPDTTTTLRQRLKVKKHSKRQQERERKLFALNGLYETDILQYQHELFHHSILPQSCTASGADKQQQAVGMLKPLERARVLLERRLHRLKESKALKQSRLRSPDRILFNSPEECYYMDPETLTSEGPPGSLNLLRQNVQIEELELTAESAKGSKEDLKPRRAGKDDYILTLDSNALYATCLSMNQPYGAGKVFSSFMSPEEEEQMERDCLDDHKLDHGELEHNIEANTCSRDATKLSDSCPGYWIRPSPREFKKRREDDYLNRSYYKQQDGSMDKPGAGLLEPFTEHGCRETFYLDRRPLYRDVRSYLVPQRVIKERYGENFKSSKSASIASQQHEREEEAIFRRGRTSLEDIDDEEEDEAEGQGEVDASTIERGIGGGGEEEEEATIHGEEEMRTEAEVNDEESLDCSEESEKDWVNRQRIYQAQRENGCGKNASFYPKANGMESEESQFCTFFTNSVFRHSSIFPGSGFQAGSGRISFGPHPKHKVDLTLFLKTSPHQLRKSSNFSESHTENYESSGANKITTLSSDALFNMEKPSVVFLSNYHGTFFHRGSWSDDNRLESQTINSNGNTTENPRSTNLKTTSTSRRDRVEHWFCPRVAETSLDFIGEQFATDMIRSLDMAILLSETTTSGLLQTPKPNAEDLNKCLEDLIINGISSLPLEPSSSDGSGHETTTLLLGPTELSLLTTFLLDMSHDLFEDREMVNSSHGSLIHKPTCWKSKSQLSKEEDYQSKTRTLKKQEPEDFASTIRKWVCWLDTPDPEDCLKQMEGYLHRDGRNFLDKGDLSGQDDDDSEEDTIAAPSFDVTDEVYETEWERQYTSTREEEEESHFYTGEGGSESPSAQHLDSEAGHREKSKEMKLSVRQMNRNRQVLRRLRSIQYPDGLIPVSNIQPDELASTRSSNTESRGKNAKDLVTIDLLQQLETEVTMWKNLARSFLPSDLRPDIPSEVQCSKSKLFFVEKLQEWRPLVKRFDTLFFFFAKQLSKLLLRWQDVRLRQATAFVTEAKRVTGLALDDSEDMTGSWFQQERPETTGDLPGSAKSVMSVFDRAKLWNQYFDKRTTFINDQFKQDFAAALTKVCPSFTIFFYKSYSSCQLFHGKSVISPSQVRVEFSRELNEFLQHECQVNGLQQQSAALDFNQIEHQLEETCPYLPDGTPPLKIDDVEPRPYHHNMKYYLATVLGQETLLHHDPSHILNKQHVTQGELLQVIRNLPDKLDKNGTMPDIQGSVSFYGGQESLRPFLSGLPFNSMGFCQSRDKISFDKDLGLLSKFQYYLQQLRNPSIMKSRTVNKRKKSSLPRQEVSHALPNEEEVEEFMETTGGDDQEAQKWNEEFISNAGEGGGGRGLNATAEKSSDRRHRRREHLEFLRRFYTSSSESEEEEIHSACSRRDGKRDALKKKKRERCLDLIREPLQHAYLDRERTVIRKSFPDDKPSSISLDYLSFLLNYTDLDNLRVVHLVLYPARPYLNDFMKRMLQKRWDIRHDSKKKLLATSLKVCGNGSYGFSGIIASRYPKTTFITQSAIRRRVVKKLASYGLSPKAGKMLLEMCDTRELVSLFKKVMPEVSTVHKMSCQFPRNSSFSADQGRFTSSEILKNKGVKANEIIYRVSLHQFGKATINRQQLSSQVCSSSKALFLFQVWILLSCLDALKAQALYSDTDSIMIASTSPCLDDLIFEPMKSIWQEYYRDKILEDPASTIVQAGKLKSEGIFSSALIRSTKFYLLGDEEKNEVRRAKSVMRKLVADLPLARFGQNTLCNNEITRAKKMCLLPQSLVLVSEIDRKLSHSMNTTRSAVSAVHTESFL